MNYILLYNEEVNPTSTHAETITFRLEPQLKAALAEKARAESKPVGEVLRGLVRAMVEQERRSQFEAEAHRQSEECAQEARDPNSAEAAILRELEDSVQYFQKEWK